MVQWFSAPRASLQPRSEEDDLTSSIVVMEGKEKGMDAAAQFLNDFDGPTPTSLPEDAVTAYLAVRAQETRFVAGERFFNYEMYGCLRRGGAVSLFTRKYCGLMVAIVASSISYFAVRNVLGVLIPQYLELTPQQSNGLRGMMELPPAFSFFVGIISDCRAPHGYHRKTLILYGFILMAIGLGMSLVVSHYEVSMSRSLGIQRTICWALPLLPFCLGMILSYTPLLARVIELTQQEQLKSRGRMLVTYLLLRIGGRCIVQLTAHSIWNSASGPLVKIQGTLSSVLVLTIVSIPFIIFCCEEGVAMTSKVRSIKEQVMMVLKLLQQKAMWQTFAVLFFVLFFLPLELPNAKQAVKTWARIDTRAGNEAPSSLMPDILETVLTLGTIVAWHRWFLNTPWRKFFAWAPILVIFPPFFIATLTAFNAVRSPVVYMIGVVSLGVGLMIRKILFHVPVTELCTKGTEGTIAGLIISLDVVLMVFGVTTMNTLKDIGLFHYEDVVHDTTHVRWMVFWTLVINLLINVISFAGLIFLPTQKLDAQLQRIYGGFTSCMGTVIISVWSAFFVYSVIVTFLPFTNAACSKLAGGNGCT